MVLPLRSLPCSCGRNSSQLGWLMWIRRQHAVAQRRAAEDQRVVGEKIGERGWPDIERHRRRIAELFCDLLGDEAGAPASVPEDADFGHFSQFTVISCV